MSLAKRFRRKVSQIQTAKGCLEWMAKKNGKYGQIRSDKPGHEYILAHRAAYELHYGPIPNGMCVLHTCDNPLCVNWEHLFLGTQQDNVDDMVSKGRQRKSQFSEADVSEMRAMSDKGLTQREIALQFGVSRPLICLLLAGKRQPSHTGNSHKLAIQ
jgi:hypothetical protein